MIRILLYIISLINVAQAVFCGYLAITNADYDGMFLLFVSIIAGILVQIGLYVHYRYLQNTDEAVFTPPNGDKPNKLGQVFGIGILMLGKWRKYADTYVGYPFFFFLSMPLFPLGCYRYKIIKSGGNRITNKFYGSEKWSGKELFCIYTYFYGGIVWFSSLLVFYVNN